jgi:hypothetical protein
MNKIGERRISGEANVERMKMGLCRRLLAFGSMLYPATKIQGEYHGRAEVGVALGRDLWFRRQFSSTNKAPEIGGSAISFASPRCISVNR